MIDYRVKAIAHLRSVAVFILLAFVVTQGPLGMTGAVTIDVWASYEGPNTFLVPSEHPVVIDFADYFGADWNVSGHGRGLVIASDGSRLVVYAPDPKYVGESNVTIAVRTPYGIMSQTISFLVYPNLDRVEVIKHNAPSWMQN